MHWTTPFYSTNIPLPSQVPNIRGLSFAVFLCICISLPTLHCITLVCTVRVPMLQCIALICTLHFAVHIRSLSFAGSRIKISTIASASLDASQCSTSQYFSVPLYFSLPLVPLSSTLDASQCFTSQCLCTSQYYWTFSTSQILPWCLALLLYGREFVSFSIFLREVNKNLFTQSPASTHGEDILIYILRSARQWVILHWTVK